ncbi:MAG: hypothetical protein HUJ98_01800 [Bacteroidaceae bacterium]|nr:hypothetical protein [Bacteroidaceae bacterium]
MKGRIAAIVLSVLAILAAIATGGMALMNNKDSIVDFHTKELGQQVFIITPDDDPRLVKEMLSNLYRQQEANQFGEERYAVYFMPGEYDESIAVEVGFYTQVAGLGVVPTDTKIEGLQCLARWMGDDPNNHNACCNFWRSVENLEIKSNTTWAVSQATDMRRTQVDGALFLHDDYGWCSGGFLADSYVTSMVDSGSQQQWLSRNCEWMVWMGENWNMVFAGLSEGAAPTGSWPVKPYTNIETVEKMREKPFLVHDENKGFGVYVPGIRARENGTDWKNGVWPVWLKKSEAVDASKDCILPLSRFYVAKPGDSAEAVNQALKEGKHLLFTPGIYEFDEPIKVENENTIVLGMGLATLRNTGDNAIMEIADEKGIVVAGLLFDAGQANPDYLIRVGENPDETKAKEIPITMSDIYCRVGGGETERPVAVDTCMIINADDVLGDNFWIWRADHGDQVAWDKNVANTGVVVNGDRVELYALMVEHFEEYQTIWKGDSGRIFMYQSEIPYDVPSQEQWMSHDGTLEGYASIYVDEKCEDFLATGLGIYLYNRDNPVVLNCAMEVPDKPGVRVENICTVMLNGYPGMKHVINDAGESVTHAVDREILLWYENKEYKN